jgi:CO/xanthine dehydrogenase FAD-binding subunit
MRVVLASQARGERTLTFSEFYHGVRRTALQDDEMLVRIEAPLLRSTEREPSSSWLAPSPRRSAL